MDKTLKDKAINFKGKEYVEVKERVKFFNETYEMGSITTERLNVDGKEYFKATVTPDCNFPNRFFTGHSQASFADSTSFVNKTSATENAETSAVGRALALMGIGVIDSIASMDEVNKTTHASPTAPQQTSTPSVVKCATCNGNTTYKTGSKADGKKWAGYFCTNKDHAPKWVKVEQTPEYSDVTIPEEPMPF